MQAGLLRERIALYAPSVTRNAYGEQVTEWRLHRRCRAWIQHKGGRRIVDNGEVTVTTAHTAKVREQVGASREMRVRWDGREYWITDIYTEGGITTLTLELRNE